MGNEKNMKYLFEINILIYETLFQTKTNCSKHFEGT